MMWKDTVSTRYPWAKIKTPRDKLLYELSKAEDEEEMELAMLGLHFDDKVDLKFFTKKELTEIKRLLKILISDTRRHHRLLGKAVKELRKMGDEPCNPNR